MRQVRRRIHEVALIKMRVAAIAECGSTLRIVRDDIVVVGDRMVVVSNPLIGDAAADSGLGIHGVDRERRREIRDRAVVVALLEVGIAPVPVGIVRYVVPRLL
jgi:hypothetical protein